MTEKDKLEMIELIQAMQKPKREKKQTKSRYMKKVVNLIFFTAFILTCVYLFFFWKFQAIPDTLVVATFGFLGAEVIALAKIKWEEVKKEDEHESNQGCD